MTVAPEYPVYIPSKGRWKYPLTARSFLDDGIQPIMVIERDEIDAYAEALPEARILVLPFENQGVTAARNWIREHSESEGHKKHWQFDDNIRGFYRRYMGSRIRCDANIALAVVENLTDRWTNIPVSGLQYHMFLPDTMAFKPFYLNSKVYSATLFNNESPYRWRPKYNEDTDLCLQVLGAGECTLIVNAYCADKQPTMVMSGGNTDNLYEKLDGRLKMARSLERDWPIAVETRHKFGRAQHAVKHNWTRFTNKPILNPDWVPVEFPELKLVGEPRHPNLQRIVRETNEPQKTD